MSAFPRGQAASTDAAPAPSRDRARTADVETRRPKYGAKRDRSASGARQGSSAPSKGGAIGKLDAHRSPRPRLTVLARSHLTPGLAVLAMVRKVRATGVELALPFGLRGIVLPTETGAALSTLAVGMWVRAVVVRGSEAPADAVKAALEKSSDAKSQDAPLLTMRPEVVNAGLSEDLVTPGLCLGGVVRSVEDHGYLVDVGVEGVRAFLPMDASDGTDGQGRDIADGAHVWVRVASVSGASGRRMAKLECRSEAMRDALSAETRAPLATLRPGTLVQTNVDAQLSSGVAVTFLGSVHGTIHVSQLPQPASGDW
jgi:rRNA biogenesis protein RRP5